MFLRRIREYIEEHRLLAPGQRVLAGVSGGVDSVALLRVLRDLGYRVEAAHVNFRLRGEASDLDEAFVRRTCGTPVHVETRDAAAYGRERGISVQMAARELRYSFFGRLAADTGIDRVAIAHHVDDQAETVLINLVRGSGPDGLRGMPVRRPIAPGSDVEVVRPLLGVTRSEVEAWARGRGLEWREDASNRSPGYRRTAIRTEVLPLLKREWGPNAARNIARSAELMRAYVEGIVDPAMETRFALVSNSEERKLDTAALDSLAPVWRRRMMLEALGRWLPGVGRTATVAAELGRLLSAQAGRRVDFGTGIVERVRGGIVFSERIDEGSQTHEAMPVYVGCTVDLPAGSLSVDVLDRKPDRLGAGAECFVFADAARLRFPLAARRWRAGDRFRPLGMRGTKKVSDFLTDLKVRSDRRRDVWLLLSGGDVVWVVGRRLSESFKVTDRTTSFARLSFMAASEE